MAVGRVTYLGSKYDNRNRKCLGIGTMCSAYIVKRGAIILGIAARCDISQDGDILLVLYVLCFDVYRGLRIWIADT